MKKTLVYSVLGLFVAALFGMSIYLSRTASITPTHQMPGAMVMLPGSDPKNTSYMLDGQHVQLIDGKAEVEAAPGSATKIVTSYFGNEVTADLNGDGRKDVAFIITQTTGGSGTFYYAVAALNTPDGWMGSDGYLMGDRIAPQATTLSQNPKQKGVVVFNFAERAPGEPMTAQPSVGKSVYLKLDPASMQWGIVEPNFEGESR